MMELRYDGTRQLRVRRDGDAEPFLTIAQINDVYPLNVKKTYSWTFLDNNQKRVRVTIEEFK